MILSLTSIGDTAKGVAEDVAVGSNVALELEEYAPGTEVFTEMVRGAVREDTGTREVALNERE